MIRSAVALLITVAIPSTADAGQGPRRIVSLAPSVTEVLFEAGLGDRVVGVTSYCAYPPEVRRLRRVGGYLTPSYEALVALQPDLVVTLPEHADIEPRIAALNIPILRVDHRSLAGIIRSIEAVGERAGMSDTARRNTGALTALVGGARRNGAAPKVLLCFGRSDDFRRLHAAAPGTVHDDLILRAGGQNALTSGAIAYPTLSIESVLRLDPDVIVEFAPNAADPAARRRQWDALRDLRAVAAGRVHVFSGEFLSVPGPRFVRFVEPLSRALRGER